MSKKIKIAVVGRPNVGKSALFNRISGKRQAIVDEAIGVTRDRLYSDAEMFGFPFQVIDTGGIVPRGGELFEEEIRRQAEIAIEEADSLIFVVDAKAGLTPLDQEIASLLFQSGKPVCLAINKIDHPNQENLVFEFSSLGNMPSIGISANHGWHIAELLEIALRPFLSAPAPTFIQDPSIHVAIIGRPNIGKSSLVNYILKEDRCIVSPIPGTTRDSIDILVTDGENRFTLIDTAGIRKKGAEHDVVDKFAAIRTERAIERADVCLLLIDSTQGLTTHEKKIAKQIEEAKKGCILLFNKWDLVKGIRMEHGLKAVEEDAHFLKHCPKLFISAKTGRNVDKVFPEILRVYKEGKIRIPTHQLNTFLEKAIQKYPPPMITGKRLRIYYLTQVEESPPTFVFFVNYPDLMTETYQKYLYNQFRETYSFPGVPLIFRLKARKSSSRE